MGESSTKTIADLNRLACEGLAKLAGIKRPYNNETWHEERVGTILDMASDALRPLSREYSQIDPDTLKTSEVDLDTPLGEESLKSFIELRAWIGRLDQFILRDLPT